MDLLSAIRFCKMGANYGKIRSTPQTKILPNHQPCNGLRYRSNEESLRDAWMQLSTLSMCLWMACGVLKPFPNGHKTEDGLVAKHVYTVLCSCIRLVFCRWPSLPILPPRKEHVSCLRKLDTDRSATFAAK